MKRTTINVGSFGVNCSVLTAGGRTWIIDPGHDADAIVRHLRENSLAPDAILLTHAHFDHISGVAGLQREFPSLPVFIHAADRAVITHPFNQYPPEYPAVPEPANLKDAAELQQIFGSGAPQVVETPGHTPGGVCYLLPDERLLFSGDTLFRGSVGRTDLPGGDMATLTNSLRKLAQLPEDVTVVPGHGPETTIGAEKRDNPFLTALA